MSVLITNANALSIPLADQSVHCIVTSPPYWGLRDYGVDGQLGNERTPEDFIANMVAVFRECWRVLRDDGTLWLNLGDSYNSIGHKKSSSGYGTSTLAGGEQTHTPLRRENTDPNLKHKDLVGIPWRVALAMQADGWYLRSDIIWHKPNPMPESVTDRPTKAHEYIFLLTKSPRYFYDAEAVKEERTSDKNTAGANSRANVDRVPKTNLKQDAIAKRTYAGFNERWAEHETISRNKRSVWTIATAPYSGAHFATYPPALVEPCIKAGTSARGVCPECGAPWEREVERSGGGIGESWTDHANDAVTGNKISRAAKGGNGYKVETIGWRPTCDCGREETVPAIVFDPFAGSGTTLMVARALGRHGVGLDLSMTYIRECAKERLGFDALDAWTNGRKAEGNHAGLPLFTTTE